MEKIHDAQFIRTLIDNTENAMVIKSSDGTNYILINTTDGAELVSFSRDIQRLTAIRDLSHHLKSEIMDDMYGRANTTNENNPQWVVNSGSDGAAADPVIDTAQAGGVFKHVTGAGDGSTAQDASNQVWSGVPIRLDSTSGTTVVEARLRIKSSVSNVAVGFGLTDSTALEEPFQNAADVITSNAADAVGFLYDTGATTDEWWGCAVDSNIDDAGNATTGVAPVADSWQILRIEVNSTGSTINFYINNATTADLSLTGDVGVGPDAVLYPYVIACGDGTASKTVDVDYVRVETVR